MEILITNICGDDLTSEFSEYFSQISGSIHTGDLILNNNNERYIVEFMWFSFFDKKLKFKVKLG
jgi:hypothetical protein